MSKTSPRRRRRAANCGRRADLEPTSTPPRGGLQPVGKDEPTLAPPHGEADTEPVKLEDKPLVPVEPLPSSAVAASTRTANKPDARRRGRARLHRPAASPLYPALLNAAPAVRAKQLTVALHWDRSLPEGIGKPMSLADCLLRDPGSDRRATIEAYWRLRQRAAEYQVLVQQAELLEDLAPVALERRNEPSGAAEMLRLHAAQLATQGGRARGPRGAGRGPICLGPADRRDGRAAVAAGLHRSPLGQLPVEAR